MVTGLPGGNVTSNAGFITVNKKYNSNLYFWFIFAHVSVFKVAAQFKKTGRDHAQ